MLACDNPAMVSVVHSLQQSSGEAEALSRLCLGLPADAAARAAEALALAREVYGEKALGTGESILQHALGMALIVASLDLDADARIAALLFAASDHVKDCGERLKAGFGDTVAGLVAGAAVYLLVRRKRKVQTSFKRQGNKHPRRPKRKGRTHGR